MAQLPVAVITSDNYSWALLPFSYLFNIFWSALQPVFVFGYNPPPFLLPTNFKFISLGGTNAPSERWSNGLISAVSRLPSHFVLLLEDYWLVRTVDVRGVSTLHDYMIERPEVLRMDLTADRLYAGGMYDADYYGHYDIIETPPSTPYQFSTQAGIWNKDLMLSLLQPNKTAWETEIHTSVPEHMRILGTRQMPVRYANAIYKGKIDRQQIMAIPMPHRQTVYNMMPPGMEVRED